ncbi:TetR family transcriptional regulator [Serratia marcescens]|uniref:TetR family transcriptional regulator n=1 Tax=Serratia marcescens TaxID=615 RepID=A0A1Q4P5J0_SERMA|nr:TetR/AcrR family transcriptional regulator [Serratia marcescens]OKB68405.1 TetR family transcriptional regulator [Serratia marcescens]
MKTTNKRLTREESQRQTRERLIETARQLFIASGYGAASIRDIAAQAGYSQGAFYSNFASKEELLLLLLQRHMQAEADQLAGLTQHDARTPAQVLAALDAWAATLNLDVDWGMLSVELQLQAQRSPTFAAEYKKVWQRHQTALASVLGALFQRLDKTPPAAPDALAAAFMAMAHGLALQKATHGGEPYGKILMVFLRGLLSTAQK